MSTEFTSREEALGVFLSILKAPVKREDLIEVPDLKIGGVSSVLLDDPGVSAEVKREIEARIEAQQGFRAETDLGNVSCVVGPFRNGFDLWIVYENGMARRM
jgi:hypothetical protein